MYRELGKHFVVVFTGAACVSGIGSSAHAALFANESFDYTAGTAGDGSLTAHTPGNGFGTNAWVALNGPTPAAVIAASIPASSGAFTAGNKATITNSNTKRAAINLDTSGAGNFAGYLDGSSNIGADNTTVYLSYLLVSNDPKNDQALELYRDGSRSLLIGLRNNDYAANAILADPAVTVATFGGRGKNAVGHFVVKIDYLNGADNITGWFNPATSGTPVAAFTNVSVADASFDAITLYSNSSSPTTSFDEIRIGQTFDDVVSTTAGTFVPEPSLFAVAGFAAMGLLRRSRK